MDPRASIIMAAALVFYSIGVWGERIVGCLKWWHLGFFILGLAYDSWGTGMMFKMTGGMTFDIHGISGFLAIALMVINAVWALIVLLKNDKEASTKFHKLAIGVWMIWLIPYFSPIFFGMAGQ